MKTEDLEMSEKKLLKLLDRTGSEIEDIVYIKKGKTAVFLLKEKEK